MTEQHTPRKAIETSLTTHWCTSNLSEGQRASIIDCVLDALKESGFNIERPSEEPLARFRFARIVDGELAYDRL